MLNVIITIKANIALVILLGTAIIASFVTYSVVRPSVNSMCPPVSLSEQAPKAVKTRVIHEINFNTRDGKRY
jgi:hypothetical protein